jgi:hypothetical protein
MELTAGCVSPIPWSNNRLLYPLASSSGYRVNLTDSITLLLA